MQLGQHEWRRGKGRPLYRMTTVDLKNLACRDEPFVLANDVAQVFYVKDMSSRSKKRKDMETNTSHDEPKRPKNVVSLH